MGGEYRNKPDMKPLLLLLAFLFSTVTYAQKIDTITFFSAAFNQERTVYVQTPAFYKYQSDAVKLPVFYILDGQHEWFANPTLSSIRYLQYTHEIPQAIIVIIPLKNRNKECGLVSLSQPEAPLHTFITREIDEKIRSYNPGDYRLLIGHSFSASFSMYSYLLSPGFYSAIIANSPLDQLENLIKAFQQNKDIEKSKLYLSYGSVDKDPYHRKAYETMKLKYPEFFNQAHTFLANFSGHSAMPIPSVPQLLNEAFNTFADRYNKIAIVDEMYKFIGQPGPVAAELSAIAASSTLNGQPYPPELPDINGIASRYLQSGYKEHGLKIYEMALKYYPNFYDFHYELAKLYADNDKQKAKTHLDKALELLKQYRETNYATTAAEITKFREKSGL
jgi:predicted alpha/beta superfamily hydrolase